MNATGYRLLGYLVWRGGKWYVRRAYLSRLPSARVAMAVGLAIPGAIAATVFAARRICD